MTKCALLVAALSASCQTPYQPKGVRGGYRSTQLAEGRHMITVNVNGYTSSSVALSYVYRRAGELCPYGFDIVDGMNDASVSYTRFGNTVQETKKPEITAVVDCRAPQTLASPPPVVAAAGTGAARWYCTLHESEEMRGGCFRTDTECAEFRGRMIGGGATGYLACTGADKAACVGAFSIDGQTWIDMCGPSLANCEGYRQSMLRGAADYERVTACEDRR